MNRIGFIRMQRGDTAGYCSKKIDAQEMDFKQCTSQ